MPRRINEYHILPTLFHQGELLIGHIITDIEDMMIINNGPDQIMAYDEHCVKSSQAFDVALTTQEASSCNVAFLTDAVSAVLGGKMRTGVSNDYVESYFIPELRGLQARFGEDHYLAAIACSLQVQKYLDRFGGYVYMVTGLKLCREKSINVRRGKGLKIQGNIGFDCGPVGAGPAVGWDRTTASSQRMTEMADAVFAVKLTKLKYKRKYVIAGKQRLVAKGHYHNANLLGEEKAGPTPDSAENFEVVFETDSDGEYDESTVNWILPRKST